MEEREEAWAERVARQTRPSSENSLSRHGSHVAALALGFWPFSHVVQLAAPREETAPEGHGRHAVRSGTLCVPAAHSSHATPRPLASRLCRSPTGHQVQLAAPRGETAPGGHGRHAVRLGTLRVPAAHTSQCVPLSCARSPPPQSVQFAEPWCEK